MVPLTDPAKEPEPVKTADNPGDGSLALFFNRSLLVRPPTLDPPCLGSSRKNISSWKFGSGTSLNTFLEFEI